MLKRVSDALDRLGRHLVAVGALLLLAMVCLINVEVSGRYLFGFSTLISDEYSGYLLCWTVLLGFLFALRNGRLLRVRAIHRRLPARVRRGLDIVNALCGALLAGILTYATGRTFWISWLFQTTSDYASQTRLFLVQFVMPLGLAILTLAFLEQAVRLVLARADSLEDGGQEEEFL